MVSTGVAERERWPFVSTLISSRSWWITTLISNSWRQGQYPADPPNFLASDTALKHCPSFDMPLTTLKKYEFFPTLCLNAFIASISDWGEEKYNILLLKVTSDYRLQNNDYNQWPGEVPEEVRAITISTATLLQCDLWWHHNVRAEILNSKSTYLVVSTLEEDAVIGVHIYYFSIDRFLKVHPKPQVVHNGLKEKWMFRLLTGYFQKDLSAMHLWHAVNYHRQSFLMHF